MTTVNELDKKRMLMKRDTDELVRVHEKNVASMWRATYHVEPVTGLMNDPNGFTSVSYTHLDVYKRQEMSLIKNQLISIKK